MRLYQTPVSIHSSYRALHCHQQCVGKPHPLAWLLHGAANTRQSYVPPLPAGTTPTVPCIYVVKSGAISKTLGFGLLPDCAPRIASRYPFLPIIMQVAQPPKLFRRIYRPLYTFGTNTAPCFTTNVAWCSFPASTITPLLLSYPPHRPLRPPFLQV